VDAVSPVALHAPRSALEEPGTDSVAQGSP
jgi:hypothetical protein